VIKYKSIRLPPTTMHLLKLYWDINLVYVDPEFGDYFKEHAAFSTRSVYCMSLSAVLT